MAERTRRDPSGGREGSEPGRRRPAVAGERSRARRTLERGAETRAARASGTAVLDRPAATAAPGPEGSGKRGPRTRRGTVVLLALLCLAITLATTAALVGYRARAAGQAEDARRTALAAAQTHAQEILSYDYRSLDKDFARARADITGSFAGDYATTTSKVVRPTAEQYKAVVKAEVAAASVVSASPDRAVVLLYVNQTTTSTRLDGPKVDLNRVRMTMVRSGGEWLVSGVDAL